MAEFQNLVLLVLLYGMQGVPLGLCLGAMCVLSARCTPCLVFQHAKVLMHHSEVLLARLLGGRHVCTGCSAAAARNMCQPP